MKRVLAIVFSLIFILVCSASAFADTISLKEGTYIVGKDLPAGQYEVTCTEDQ